MKLHRRLPALYDIGKPQLTHPTTERAQFLDTCTHSHECPRTSCNRYYEFHTTGIWLDED